MAESAFLAGDRVRLSWNGSVVVVVNTCPCPNYRHSIFSYYLRGEGELLCHDSDAVLVTRSSLEEMLKECL